MSGNQFVERGVVRGDAFAVIFLEDASMTDTVGLTEAPASAADSAAISTGVPLGTASLQPPPHRHGRNYTWSELMRRVFEIDVLECPRCRGRMRILAAIHHPDATRKILECLGLPSRAPPLALADRPYTVQPK